MILQLAYRRFYRHRSRLHMLYASIDFKFAGLYAHGIRMVIVSDMSLLSGNKPLGLAPGVEPFAHGMSYHTDVMKTHALDATGFNVVFGCARRDDEKTRAKEQVFCFSAAGQRCGLNVQRPELWSPYMGVLRLMRVFVFPQQQLSMLDIGINHHENMPIVPLCSAAYKPELLGMWSIRFG